MRIGERDCRRLCDELLAERGLNGKDFFGRTRLQPYVDARIEAIKRMKEFTKASHETIAFVLNKESSIVRYHLSETNKARRLRYQVERYHRNSGSTAFYAKTARSAPTDAPPQSA